MTAKSVTDLVFFAEHEAEFMEYATPQDKCLDGQPLQRLWHHYASPGEKFLAGLWEAEPGRWRVDYSEYEYCHILSGRSVVRDDAGGERELEPGDDFVIPAGFRGEWEVLETTRKIYVIFQP